MNLPFYCITPFLFVFINLADSLRCPELSVKYGRVKYRSRGRVATFGCWGGYSLYGDRYAGCFRGSWDVQPPKCVMKGCSEVSFKFGYARKPLGSTAVFSFRCFQGYDLIGPREIYCDGSSFDALPPICKRTETDMACDFENNNFCKWRNDNTQNLTFTLINKAPPSRILNTGPDHDHSLEPNTNGYYIYLETSATVPGEAARLVTPNYLPHAENNNTCFLFWYHMYGQSIGGLRVYINDTVAFEKKANRGDRWRLGKVKLPTQSHFKIIVEAITGRGYLGDIALDDFDLGECTDSKGETCLNRCTEDERDPFAACDCHAGCEEESSCCSDYFNYCVAKTTSVYGEMTTASSDMSTAFDEFSSSFSSMFSNSDEYLDGKSLDYATDKELLTEVMTEPNTLYTELLTEFENSYDPVTEEIDVFTSKPFQPVSTQNYIKSNATTNSLTDNAHIAQKSSSMPVASTETSKESTKTIPRYNLDSFTANFDTIVSIPRPTLQPSQKITNATNSKHARKLTTALTERTTSPTTIVHKTPLVMTQKPISPTIIARKTTTRVTQRTSSPTTIVHKTPSVITQKPISPTIIALLTTHVTQRMTRTTKVHTPTTKFTRRTSNQTVTTALQNFTTKTTTTTPIPSSVMPKKSMKFTPFVHRPMTVSKKDPKITTLPPILPTTNSTGNETIVVIHKLNETLVMTPTETLTDTGTDLQTQLPLKKWKSIYKKKGAFKLIDNNVANGENVHSTGVTSIAAICLILLVGSLIAVVLFLRKRRLSSGPSDGAEIVFIPADELLDFTPASGGANRDSGVYSDTVMSIKRDKGLKR